MHMISKYSYILTDTYMMMYEVRGRGKYMFKPSSQNNLLQSDSDLLTLFNLQYELMTEFSTLTTLGGLGLTPASALRDHSLQGSRDHK